MLEQNLQVLAQSLPADKEPFINFLRTSRDLHSVTVMSEFNPGDPDFLQYEYEVNFDFLYENFNLNQTLKTHVIMDHYGRYFNKQGTNFRTTNGEFLKLLTTA